MPEMNVNDDRLIKTYGVQKKFSFINTDIKIPNKNWKYECDTTYKHIMLKWDLFTPGLQQYFTYASEYTWSTTYRKSQGSYNYLSRFRRNIWQDPTLIINIQQNDYIMLLNVIKPYKTIQLLITFSVTKIERYVLRSGTKFYIFSIEISKFLA